MNSRIVAPKGPNFVAQGNALGTGMTNSWFAVKGHNRSCMPKRLRATWQGIVTCSLLLLCASFAAVCQASDRKEAAPTELEEVGITEHLDGQLPLDLTFLDSDGKPVRLGDYFDGTRPVILTLNYSDCPMLCSLQLTGLWKGLAAMDWDLGDNFEMITVSIDPHEQPKRAEETKQKYLKQYGRSGVADGWHCLTGKQADITKLAQAVGFGYNLVPETGEFAHVACTFIVTPDGRISRYLYGVDYDPQTLKLSLVEASEGKVGSTLDKVVLFCFQYDATKGRYGPAAVGLMKLGGALTVVVLGGVLGVFWGARLEESQDGRAE